MRTAILAVSLCLMAAPAAPGTQAPGTQAPGTQHEARGTRHEAPDVVAFVTAYAEGRHDQAVAEAAALPDLGPFRVRVVQDLPGWIAADPAAADHRRAAVAGFIVELAAARQETDWGRLSDLVEWACVQLQAGPPTPFERAWHMATTALAGRARARVWLLGPFARLPHQKPRPPQKDDPPSPRHLMHALERFPEDPHFQLARVMAWLWSRDGEPTRNMRADWRRNQARWAPARAPQLEALTALEPFTAISAVAAEALIRVGLIHVTVSDHAAALNAFERAQAAAVTPPLRYLSYFLAGRSLEVLRRPDDAIAAYRRALTIVPNAESATVALASLLFLRNEREASVALIDQAFASAGAPTDPGRLTGYGFYLHWPSLKAAMRAELAP